MAGRKIERYIIELYIIELIILVPFMLEWEYESTIIMKNMF